MSHKWHRTKLVKNIFCSFLYPRVFFGQVWYVAHTISTSSIYFRLRLLILVILSYIAAEYNHFRPFYRNLKNCHLAKKSMLFSWKSKFSAFGLTNKGDWRDHKHKYAQKNILFIISDVFEYIFNVFIKLKQNLFTFFSFFRKKNMDFLATNEYFPNFD